MNNVQKNIQKISGIKMGKYDNIKNELYHQSKLYLQTLEIFIKQVELNNMTNEQFFLDFENKLNSLSIKDHNASPE